MLVVRETWTATPGNASKFAKMMKKMMPEARVMTDMIGTYNTVVAEWEVDSLADFEKQMAEYGKDMSKEQQEEMKQYNTMYSKGKREIMRVW